MNAELRNIPVSAASPGPRTRRHRSITLVFLSAALCLGGCWDDGPIPVEEPLEIILGSSELEGGQLVADFDFGVSVPVVFNTEVGGFSIYSGTEPGFVALGSRNAGSAPFGFIDGTPIGMRITEIDPEVQILFADGLLSQVGDEVEIGESPFDTHPTWQLAFPAGAEPAPRFVSFVLTTSAPEYAESEEYTVAIVVAEEEPHDH